MGKWTFIAGLAGLLAAVGGCAQGPTTAVVYHGPNLALGTGAENNQLAEWFQGRSRWPMAEGGYRFDDVTYSFESAYDDQSFYEDDGGGFYYDVETYRQSILVR